MSGFFNTQISQINTALRRVASKVAGATDVGSARYDPTGAEARQKLLREQGLVLGAGKVVRSGVAGYDFTVDVNGMQVPCTMLQHQTSNGFGCSDGAIPVEGSNVVVLMREGGMGFGWIIGSMPNAQYTVPNKKPAKKTFYQDYPDPATNVYKQNAAYFVPYQKNARPDRIWANSNRPTDVLPGESASINENCCGTVTSMYDVEITGGNSFIRVGSLDDEIRMRSTNYTKWTAAQAVHEFNDGGLVSSEGRDYAYQGELLGAEGRKGPETPDKNPSSTEGREPRPRTRFWKGFLGNLYSLFFVRARKRKDEFDQGLGSIHVSQSGNAMVRMAGGVSLERYDAIPVPKRLKAEWDPEGDREIDTKHEPLEPFDLGDDPCAAGLLKSSQMAWEQKLMYQRFDELKKDFSTPEEKDVPPLENEDGDPFGSKTELKKYAGRRAGVFIGPDGSVIIRDAWGSEIVMAGGNVFVNASGSVVTTAHRDAVTMAGGSTVLRGSKSAEMTSDDGHVRLQAYRMVEIAGGTDKSPGGVLIQALGEGPQVNAKQGAGDQARLSGVVIRAHESGVSLSAKDTYVTGRERVFVTGGMDGNQRSGDVFINGKNVIATGSEGVSSVVKDNTCAVTQSGAFLMSDSGSAYVYGDYAMIQSGDQVPVVWDAVDPSQIPDLTDLDKLWAKMQEGKLIRPFNWTNLERFAQFSFRSSSQSGTDKGLSGNDTEFRMYEPYWQVMGDLGSPLVKETGRELEVDLVNETLCWPGKEAAQSGKFARVSVFNLNVDDAVSKARSAVTPDVSVTYEPFTKLTI